ncbi:unnamed protein product [Caenorhabditis bovis]|uniref:Dolichyl-diphosphooligosaccharide--protein glycosyltransferase subunit 2 n=1 Tax=Caenorhabditis bovis TaxID=2654633 RepID=A0A8S1FA99_9PELO|nr:unnamed protein product [Caenorhabditis bovis]
MRPIIAILALITLAYAAVDDITVESFKIGFLAKDQDAKDEHLKKMAVFSKASGVLSGDANQRLYVKFDIQKKSDKSKVAPEQVFLRFEHSTGEDVILALESQSTGGYLYDTSLRVAAKKFNHLTGSFKASLIVGGKTVKNPINWTFADLELALPSNPPIVPKSQKISYDVLPEIVHQFRQPEKRPPAVISDAFTIICLLPLAFLLAVWFKIGINFDNAPASPWVIIFHGGLAGILALYLYFWIKIDMFETLKYLSVLGFITFVAGNRVLRALATDK